MAGRVLSALRRGTGSIHRRLHTHPVLEPLQSNFILLLQYITAWKALTDFHLSLSRAADPLGVLYKEDWERIARDSDSLPSACRFEFEPPRFKRPESVEELYAYKYIIEGSRLGSLLIAKNVFRSLKIDEHSGAAFFHGEPHHAAGRWKRFLTDLEADCADEIGCAIHARRVFEALENWLWHVHRMEQYPAQHTPGPRDHESGEKRHAGIL